MTKPTTQTSLRFIIVILLLAFGLRLLQTIDLPLWTDEGWTIWYVETQSPIETIIRLFENRHPPLYFVVLSAWQNFAGNSHLALRIIAIFSGMISVAFVYRIAANWFDTDAALFTALLFAVLDIAVYYTVEVRHYSWLTMMAIITSALFLRYIKQPNRHLGIAYLLSVTGLMLTHYFGLFIMILQAVFGLFVWQTSWREKRNLVGIWVGAFVLYLPWMVVVIWTLSAITRGVGNFPGSFTSSYADFLRMLNLLFDGQIALLGGMYVVGLFSLRKVTLARAYVIAAGGGLFLMMFGLNNQIGVLSPRMIYYLTPFLVIICGYGLAQLSSRVRPVVLGVYILVALGTSQLIQPRLNYANAIEMLDDTYRTGELIVLETGWTDHATEYEISQAIPTSEATIFNTARIWNPTEIIETADAQLLAYDTVWVVQWLHAPVILPRLLDGWLGYELVDEYAIMNEQPVASSEPIRMYRFQRPELENEPLIFGGTIALHDAIYNDTVTKADDIEIDLWWEAIEAIDRDYSIGLFISNTEGDIVAQTDTAIADTPSSQWIPDTYIHSLHSLSIPADLPTGNYTLNAVVYYFETPEMPLSIADQAYAPLGTVTINQ